MDGVAMEGPLPPLMKIDDDVEGVGGGARAHTTSVVHGPLSSPTRIAGGPGWREGSILKYMRRAMYKMNYFPFYPAKLQRRRQR